MVRWYAITEFARRKTLRSRPYSLLAIGRVACIVRVIRAGQFKWRLTANSSAGLIPKR